MEKQVNTIEEIIEITANNLRNLCAAPMHMEEGVRYSLAVNVQNLQRCLDVIKQSKEAQKAAAGGGELTAEEEAAEDGPVSDAE